jgi:pSer/pThr/pTyr-binding forkhead associated (FHA) protein
MKLDGTYLIGRPASGSKPRPGMLTIDHPTVSQQHAELVVLNGSYYLRDLGSRNGIWRHREGQMVALREGYVEPSETLLFGQAEVRLGDLLTGGLVSS